MINEFIAHIRQSDREKQTVAQHLQETGTLAKKHAQKIGMPLIGELCGLLHDIGKYGDEFQLYIKSEYGLLDPDSENFDDVKGKKNGGDHSTAGAQFLWKDCKKGDSFDLLLRQMLSLSIASHHSGLLDCIEPKDGTDSFSKRMEKSDEKTHLSEVKQKIDSDVLRKITTLLQSPELRAELEMQKKKILNLERKVASIRDFRYGLLTRFLFSCLIDADRTNTADFASRETAAKRLRGQYVDWNKLIEALERRLSEFTVKTDVDPLRSEISNHCRDFAQREKGLYSLTVPTGGGKTLASLRFALSHAKKHEMTHIIYVVPYISIIDQNADEVRKIFHALSEEERQDIVLEHHSNLSPEKETLQGKIIAENWDAQIIYTTAVQFLETLFSSGTRGVRRMHQLANAVIIFDEVQTLPVRIVHLFNNAINFLLDLCGSTVVFCTATQPCLDNVEPTKGAVKLTQEQEMMPDVKDYFRKLQRVEVRDERKAGGWSEEEIAELAYKCVKSAKSVLIIVNTKQAAKQLYQLCKTKQNDMVAVYHLSTNMCPAHRLDILAKVKECLNPDDPHPVICISTQLIEAGVDVDFGSVIRYLAGLDSIAQAAGRCNRNGRREKGLVYVVNPSHENLDRLEEIRIAQEKAQRILDEYQRDPQAFDHDIIGIEAMQRYYKYYFFDRASQMAYPISRKEFDHEDDLLTLLSTNGESVKIYQRNNSNQSPPIFLRQAFKSAAHAFKAIDTATQGVIVPYCLEGKRIIDELQVSFDPGKQFKLIKLAQRYSVNLFPQAINALSENRAIFEVQAGSGILYLQPEFYSNDFGVSHEVINEMECLSY